MAPAAFITPVAAAATRSSASAFAAGAHVSGRPTLGGGAPAVAAASGRGRAARLAMKVTIEEAPLPNSMRGVTIHVSADEVALCYNKVVKDLQKRATIPGFRAGKVPRKVVLNHFGKATVTASAVEEVIQHTVQQALSSLSVSAIGQAQLAEDVQDIVAKFDPESELSFGIKVDVWPEATLTADYKGLTVSAQETAFDESIVDDALEQARRREAFTVLSPADAVAEIGRVAVGSLVGFYRNEDGSRGEALPDIASGESVEIKLRTGQYMAGFVEGILGMKAGDVRDVAVEFPAESARPELRGVKAIFEVTVSALKDEVLPELNDDFARSATEHDTLEALRADIRQRLGEETDGANDAAVSKALEAALAEITDVELPETLIDEQAKTKFATMMSDFKSKGNMSDEQIKSMITQESYQAYRKSALKNIVKSLTANLAITKIAQLEGIEAEPAEVEEQMALIKAEMKGKPLDDEASVRDKVVGQVLRQKVLAFLKETAVVTMTTKATDAEAAAAAAAAEADAAKEPVAAAGEA